MYCCTDVTLENNEFTKVSIKNRTCYYFDDIIKNEEIDFDNISRDEKSDKDILIYDVSYKILIRPKPFNIILNKVDGFIRVYEFLKNTMLFTI